MKTTKIIALAIVAVLLVFAVSCAAEAKPEPEPESKHVHALGEKHEAVAGTCKTKGTLAYWECTGCEEKLDADGKVLASIEGELDPDNHESTGTRAVNICSPMHHDLYTVCCNHWIGDEDHSAPCSACGFILE